MTTIRPSLFLRRATLADALASGATGLLMIVGANMIDALLGLPAVLLREAGLVLVPYVAFVLFVATRETVSTSSVWAIIVCNVLWAAGSVALLVSGWVAPTLIGYLFVAAQALVVAVFGELQYVGLRRPLATAG